MVLSVSPNLRCFQSSILTTPPSFCHSPKPSASIHSDDSNSTLSHRLIYGSPFRGFKNSRTQRVKRACSADSDNVWGWGSEFTNLIKEIEKIFYPSKGDDVSEDTQNRDVKIFLCKLSPEKFPTTMPDPLHPSELGIQPEPPSWPERHEMLKQSIERKLKPIGSPIPMKIVKKRLLWTKSSRRESDFTDCSMKQAFSNMLFIFHTLQNHALQITESLFFEDLQQVKDKFREDMNASFMWLFQKILWKTPTLLLDMMVFLASFSVYSMANLTVIAETPTSKTTNVRSLSERNNKKGLKGKEKPSNWDLEEVLRLRDEHRRKHLNKKTLKFETKETYHAYKKYKKRDDYYRKNLSSTPNNSLLLSNYAQFLYLVVQDYAR